MPRRDGTGPIGMGSITGRGMGFCNVAKVAGAIGGLGLGLGLGCKRGFGRNGFNDTVNLENQKAILEDRLNMLNNQLKNLQDDK